MEWASKRRVPYRRGFEPARPLVGWRHVRAHTDQNTARGDADDKGRSRTVLHQVVFGKTRGLGAAIGGENEGAEQTSRSGAGMTGATGTVVRKWLQLLPWPLANALKRAHNDKTAQGRHNAAYYFFEASLKMAACAQVGSYLALCASDPKLDEELKSLAKASAGSWLQMLNLFSAYIARRPDAALLPLSGVYKRLTEPIALPAARAFLDRNETKLGQGRTTIMELFGALVAHRNDEMGHGAQRDGAFYEAAAPLILHAALESLDHLQPFGDLKLALSRDVAVERTGETARRFMLLEGDGLHTWMDAASADAASPAGRLWLIGGASRIPLHPLMIYEAGEMDRVGFLNKVVGRPKGDAITIKRCEYLDYYSGERLQSRDAATELAALFSQLYQTRVTTEDVEKLSMEPAAETSQSGPSTGHVTIGDFEILGELGRGGMGVVYKARQLTLGRIVALKVLPPALSGDPIAVARFRREIKALGMCDHPNLVKVLTAGQDGDRHFYAMEYVDGCDLSALYDVLSAWGKTSGNLREGHITQAITSAGKLCQARKDISDNCEGLSEEQVREKLAQVIPEMPQLKEGRAAHERLAELMSEAADGLQHMHERGIIHRDLKPGNLMLTADGSRIVLMDFGLAQLENASLSLTRSADKILGTLRYMAPEQADAQLRGELVSERSDIYSFGATLYELTTLKPIFDGQSQVHLLEQVQRKEPLAPSKANPGLPRDLEAIIIKATQKDRDLRYAKAGPSTDEGTIGADLKRFANGEHICARPPSKLHYLKLFYRRNKAIANTVAATAMILILATTAFIYTLEQRRQEAEETRAVALRERDEKELLAKAERTARAEAVRQRLVTVDLYSGTLISTFAQLKAMGRLDVLAPVARVVYEQFLQDPQSMLTGDFEMNGAVLINSARVLVELGEVDKAARLAGALLKQPQIYEPNAYTLRLDAHIVRALALDEDVLIEDFRSELALIHEQLAQRELVTLPSDRTLMIHYLDCVLQFEDRDWISAVAGLERLLEELWRNQARSSEAWDTNALESQSAHLLATSYINLGQLGNATGVLGRGIDNYDRNTGDWEPGKRHVRSGVFWSTLGYVQSPGSPSAAKESLDKAVLQLRLAVGSTNSNFTWRIHLVRALYNRLNLKLYQSRMPAPPDSPYGWDVQLVELAIEDGREARTLLDELLSRYPRVLRSLVMSARVDESIAAGLCKLGKTNEAETIFLRAFETRRAVFSTNPRAMDSKKVQDSCGSYSDIVRVNRGLEAALSALEPMKDMNAFAYWHTVALFICRDFGDKKLTIPESFQARAIYALKSAKKAASSAEEWKTALSNRELDPLRGLAAWEELSR
ncbi:MAG: serine/threonine protein kinase [Planctomycetes bacterium]|nr:serine/threonine protein kinase [Planctomycetota bacterium]